MTGTHSPARAGALATLVALIALTITACSGGGVTIEDTAWVGTTETGEELRIDFAADGTADLLSRNDPDSDFSVDFEGATWVREGDVVTVDFADQTFDITFEGSSFTLFFNGESVELSQVDR